MQIYLSRLTWQLFAIEPKFWKQKGNTAILCLRSKEVVNFMSSNGMQIGKKNDLKLPLWIKENPSLMAAFVRGFADTDGNLTFKKRYRNIHYYPAISVSSINKSLIEEIRQFLLENGFGIGKIVKSIKHIKGYDKSYVHFRIFLYGKDNLEKWIKLINFSNMKHKSKYNAWKKLGYSPPNSSTQSRIEIIKNPLSEI